MGRWLLNLLGFLSLRPPPRFVISIRQGTPSVERGRVPPGFLAFCQEFCAERGLDRGRIAGFKNARGISLEFSKEIPEEHRQKFRNVWLAET